MTFLIVCSNNMLYPREDKINKQLLYAVSYLWHEMLSDEKNCVCVRVYVIVWLVQELWVLPTCNEQLHLCQQDHPWSGVSTRQLIGTNRDGLSIP